jgi:hypothetical protein
MPDNDELKPKPGQGSLLEGSIDASEDTKRTLGLACNLIFSAMTLGMCQQLNMAFGQALDGPLLSNDLAGMSAPLPAPVSLARNSIAPGLSAPSLPTPKIGGLL